MTKTLRIFGPPGTGKTTTLSRRTLSTVRDRGPDSIVIASFSVTAAQEIANRPEVRQVLPKGAVGTLHSHAYRAMAATGGERPPVATDPKVISGWNEIVGPTWQITGDSRGGSLASTDRGGVGGDLATGDSLLEQLDLMRAGQTPGAQWPVPLRGFAKRWTEWKREAGVVDFSDMIITAIQQAREGQGPPGDPSVLIMDEAQDLTPIESMLALEWGEHLGEDGRLVFALDDDQAIFDWRGGDPRLILAADAEDDVLALSHRVPPAVHAVANAWIQRVSTRYDKTYLPREPNPQRDPSEAHARGWAYRTGHTLNDTALVDQIEGDLHDPDDPDATVMVLASCGYMLNTLISTLRKRGIPFHNPFRPGDKLWNPLTPPASGMSTPERLWRYLVLDQRELGERARLWTGDDLHAWIELISNKQAHLVQGVSRILGGLPGSEPVPWDHLAAMFRETADGDEALHRATCGGPDALDHLEWLASVVAPSKAKVTAYPLQVARSQGSAALIDTPRLVVGTIHSVKGATASRVYVAPDLSGAGMRQWRSGQAGQDQITRLMYVAMTRAYHRLCVLTPTAGMGVNTTELIPPALEVRP